MLRIHPFFAVLFKIRPKTLYLPKIAFIKNFIFKSLLGCLPLSNSKKLSYPHVFSLIIFVMLERLFQVNFFSFSTKHMRQNDEAECEKKAHITFAGNKGPDQPMHSFTESMADVYRQHMFLWRNKKNINTP